MIKFENKSARLSEVGIDLPRPTISDLIGESLGRFRFNLRVPDDVRNDPESKHSARLDAVEVLRGISTRHPAITAALFTLSTIEGISGDLKNAAMAALACHDPKLSAMVQTLGKGMETSALGIPFLSEFRNCIFTPSKTSEGEVTRFMGALQTLSSKEVVLALGSPVALHGSDTARPLMRTYLSTVNELAVDVLTGNFIDPPI